MKLGLIGFHKYHFFVEIDLTSFVRQHLSFHGLNDFFLRIGPFLGPKSMVAEERGLNWCDFSKKNFFKNLDLTGFVRGRQIS